jgi:hypothetical protein
MIKTLAGILALAVSPPDKQLLPPAFSNAGIPHERPRWEARGR